MKQTYKLLILILLTALLYEPLFSQNNTTNTFSKKTENSRSRYIIPRAAYSVAAGDLDQDGDNDIVVGHNYCWKTNWSGVSIMLNDGFGYFELYDSVYLYGGQSDILILNLNNESSLEIVAKYVDAELENEYIAIINDLNLSNISYYSLNTYEGVGYKTSGDVNGDDFTDILMASNDGQFWGVMYNNGSGQMSEPYYKNVYGYFPLGIACGDLNENGRDDVAVCGQSTEVYFSYPEGFESLLLEDSDAKTDVYVIDFDSDGDNDLLTSVGLPIINISVLKMFENLGGGIFDTLGVFYFQGLSTDCFLSDFNNDSLPDALFTLIDNSGLVLFYNQGNFQLGDSTFIHLESYGQYEGLRDCSCADFDGNGFNDIAITRQAQIQLPDNLVILFNDGNGNFVEDPIAEIKNLKIENNAFLNCYPNPFTQEITIQIYLDDSNNYSRIMICDLIGNMVKTIPVKDSNIGKYNTIKWDGKDDSGRYCKPGVYIVMYKVNNNVINQIKIIKYN